MIKFQTLNPEFRITNPALSIEKREPRMIYEDIFEPIEVISLFKDGKIKPLRFKWNGRVYKINRLNGHWISPQGYTKQYHFSLMADTYDYFEIMFDTSNFEWQIARVCLEG
jgi:hypothetical protein